MSFHFFTDPFLRDQRMPKSILSENAKRVSYWSNFRNRAVIFSG
ncbi:hypothetical protein HMPREF1508_1373 [Shuttleworthella sp. MSX8B]|nr:hypothetical protein HMPREF1508_1373 [Shuttleworthia sp. MSX8B]